ncbi:MAG: HupE/UreJ family protein [Bauldia sp.]|nr:HupE/UreJ family protein [Bauldia sp.]
MDRPAPLVLRPPYRADRRAPGGARSRACRGRRFRPPRLGRPAPPRDRRRALRAASRAVYGDRRGRAEGAVGQRRYEKAGRPVTRLRPILLLVALLGLSQAAIAHELRPAFLELIETAPDRFDVLWKVPARGEARLALDATLPESCTETGPRTVTDTGIAVSSRWSVACEGGLAGRTIAIGGLRATYTDVLLRIEAIDGVQQSARLTPDNPGYVVLAAPSTFDTARTYLVLGVEHILLGIDHLLFVLALLLLIRNLRTLIETITAFTVAHSITLAAAALGWAVVPQPPIEAAIALSIVVVASEIVRAGRGATDLSIRFPWLIAFLFGLLHGFGFGGALRDIGLPQKDVPLALFTFNLGVEAGQLLFVAAVLAVLAAVRALVAAPLPRARMAAAYGIGAVSAFWFVQRVLSF